MKKYYALSFLIWALPIMAEKRDVPCNVSCNMSECELYDLCNDSYCRTVYFGKDVSNIAAVLKEISVLDENQNSSLKQLLRCIDQGCMFGEWDAVAQTLDYADFILKKYHTRLPKKTVKRLATDLELIITQMINGGLCADAPIPCFSRFNENCNGADKEIKFCFNADFKENVQIDKSLDVKGKTKLHGKLIVFEDAFFKEKVHFKKPVTFNNISVNEATINNLTVTDLVVKSCIDHLCVTNLSVTELAVASCIDHLCVINLSVVNETATNLSVVNETVTNLSATNAVIENLSVTELVVLSCIDNLCVVNLSVTNFVASTIDAVCNLSVGCDIFMVNSTDFAHGNIIKGANSFIHNFGTDNTFVGINAGNFIMGGAENVGVGRQALFSNTTGFENVAVGGFALPVNTIGENDIAIGAFSLASNTTG